MSLTQTDAKGSEHKQKLVVELREALEEFERIFVFSFANFRTTHMKDIRMAWKDSRCSSRSIHTNRRSLSSCRFFMGKNKVMAVAFGRSDDDEYQDNMAGLGKVRTDVPPPLCSDLLISQLLMKSGESGVVYTNRTRAEVEECARLAVPADTLLTSGPAGSLLASGCRTMHAQELLLRAHGP